MDDVEQRIVTGWERIKARVLSDPAELRRRLARMNRRNLAHVPRVWTYALRAGDTRLRSPVVEFNPRSVEVTLGGGRCGRHEVRVDRRALIELGRPVDVMRCSLKEAAARLGVRPQNLVPGRIKGTFRATYVEWLGGHGGKPNPILTADGWLDPTTRGFGAGSAERAWGWTGQFDASRIPNVVATLVRVPHVQAVAAKDRYRDTTALHPEHPAVAGEDGMDVARRRKSRCLPEPPPDDAWYKWKDGEYLGYDWRLPGAKERFERREASLATIRVRRKVQRRENPPPIVAAGSLTFKGWRWLCPQCGRRVQVLHLPLPPVNFVTLHDVAARAVVKRAGVRRSWPAATFACAACHRVRVLTRASKDFWNDLIAYLSGGLLYGAEVTRPPWLTRQRRRAYAPRPNAPPAPRRLMVQERLLKGWPYKRIAADMNISAGTVDTHAQAIYEQHRVHGRAELIRQLGATPEVALTHWRDRLEMTTTTRASTLRRHSAVAETRGDSPSGKNSSSMTLGLQHTGQSST